MPWLWWEGLQLYGGCVNKLVGNVWDSVMLFWLVIDMNKDESIMGPT